MRDAEIVLPGNCSLCNLIVDASGKILAYSDGSQVLTGNTTVWHTAIVRVYDSAWILDENSTIINAGPTVLNETSATNLNVSETLMVNGSEVITELVAGPGIAITGTGSTREISATGSESLTPITSVTFDFTGAAGSCSAPFMEAQVIFQIGNTPRFFVNIETGTGSCATNALFATIQFGEPCTATPAAAWACFIQPAFGTTFSTGQQGLVTSVVGGSTTAVIRTTDAAASGENYAMFLDCQCY